MDPLSICASVVALSALAGNASKLLCRVTKTAINAETQISSLVTEITTLTGFLSSVNKTLAGCKSHSNAFELVDDELWEQSDLALQDCDATLTSLTAFVEGIKSNQKRNFWKVRVAIDLSIHARELERFRTSLRKSNCALQTVLHTITLSLTLQNNASQTLILATLDKLKRSIDDALRTAARPPSCRQRDSPTCLSDTITTKNLHSLAKAAQNFYFSASSAASSAAGSSAATACLGLKDTANSVAGLDPMQTERLYYYIRGADDFETPPVTNDNSRPVGEWNTPWTDKLDFPEEPAAEWDLDRDLQLPLIDVLEDFAVEKMKEGDFSGAASFLEEAVSGKLATSPAADIHIRLRTRLAICYMFQGDRTKCEAAIEKVEHLGGMLDLEALNLLHAVALSYLFDYRFQEAKNTCTTVLRAKARLLGRFHPETLQTLGLLAKIYDEFDEVIHHEATRRMIPRDFVYNHPENEREFLRERSRLLPDNCHTDGTIEIDGDSNMGRQEYPVSDVTAHALQMGELHRSLSRYEKIHANTMKEVVPNVEGAEDATVDSPKLKRSLSQSVASMVQNSSLRRSLSAMASARPHASSEDIFKLSKSKTLLKKRRNTTASDNSGSRLSRVESMFGLRRSLSAPSATYVEAGECNEIYELDSTPIENISPPIPLQINASNDKTRYVAGEGQLRTVPKICPNSRQSSRRRSLSIANFRLLDTISEVQEPPTTEDNIEKRRNSVARLNQCSVSSRASSSGADSLFDGSEGSTMCSGYCSSLSGDAEPGQLPAPPDCDSSISSASGASSTTCLSDTLQQPATAKRYSLGKLLNQRKRTKASAISTKATPTTTSFTARAARSRTLAWIQRGLTLQAPKLSQPSTPASSSSRKLRRTMSWSMGDDATYQRQPILRIQ